MVGVPRSKGCRNCVQSRVKCDQTRPSCLRCEKRAISCPGYGQNLKFQDEGPRLEQHYKKKAQTPWVEDSSTPQNDPKVGPVQLANGLDEMDNFLASMEDLQNRPDSANAFAPSAIVGVMSGGPPAIPFYMKASFVAPSTSINPSSYQAHAPLLDIVNSPELMQTQLLSWYINSTTFANKDLPGPKYQLEWLKQVLEHHHSSKLLSNAVRACTLSHLGRLYDSEPLLRSSSTFYQTALHCLAKTLNDDRDNGREARSSITLAATLFLSIYEMYTCTTDHSWVKHAGGAGTLMRMRGPRAHRDGFDKAMYLAFRNILIVEAFESDKPCFLNEPEWRQLDDEISAEFSNMSPLIVPMERFYAECVAVPGLSSDTLAAFKHKGSDEEYGKVLRDLMCRGITHRANFLHMLSNFEATLKSTSQWVAIVPNPDLEDSVFPEIYDFSDIFISTVIGTTRITLCAINLMMLDISKEYHQVTGESIFDHVIQPSKLRDGFQVPELSSRDLIFSEMQDHARKGCMCVPWMSQSNFIGPFYATFALRIARRTLTSAREIQWVRTKMRETGKKMGIASMGLSREDDMPDCP